MFGLVVALLPAAIPWMLNVISRALLRLPWRSAKASASRKIAELPKTRQRSAYYYPLPRYDGAF
jgi:hypothetical protein